MAKKKNAKKKAVSASETIQFRPGEHLGALINEVGDELSLSRGEVSKRLISLAIRGLDLGWYSFAADLIELKYGSVSFDDACHHLHVCITDAAKASKRTPEEMPREEKLAVVKALLDNYRMMRGFEEKVGQQRVTIKLVRND